MKYSLLVFSIIFFSCESQFEKTGFDLMPPKQNLWFDSNAKYGTRILASKNDIDKEYQISSYKIQFEKYLSVDSNKYMKDWVSKVLSIERMNDSVAVLSLEGCNGEKFITYPTNKVDLLRSIGIDSFIAVSGIILPKVDIEQDGSDVHAKFMFLLDSVKKLPVNMWYNKHS